MQKYIHCLLLLLIQAQILPSKKDEKHTKTKALTANEILKRARAVIKHNYEVREQNNVPLNSIPENKKAPQQTTLATIAQPQAIQSKPKQKIEEDNPTRREIEALQKNMDKFDKEISQWIEEYENWVKIRGKNDPAVVQFYTDIINSQQFKVIQQMQQRIAHLNEFQKALPNLLQKPSQKSTDK